MRPPKPRSLLIAAAAVLMAGALVALLSGGSRAADSGARGTLRLVVEFNRFADARDDVAPRGDSPGDQVMFSDPVFAADNRTRVGRAMFLNTFQEGSGVLVTGALALRRGTITLAGARLDGAGDLAVTGGTGAYAGARGTYEQGGRVELRGEDGPVRERVLITFSP